MSPGGEGGGGETDVLKYFTYAPHYNIIHIYSGITSDRVLNAELLYTKILEVNLFAFAYRLFHEDFSSVIRDLLLPIRYMQISNQLLKSILS